MPTTKTLTAQLSVAAQLLPDDLPALAAAGITTLINNRPDQEAPDQPSSADLAAAATAAGLSYHYLPIIPGQLTDDAVAQFAALLAAAHGPVLAFCRTGTRSTTLWALTQTQQRPVTEILAVAQAAGYDLSALTPRLAQRSQAAPTASVSGDYDVVVVGGGAAGCAVSASLLRRQPSLRIAIVEPANEHYYQPGWTLVGAGVFDPRQTVRAMADCIPKGVTWLRGAVAEFLPDAQQVLLEDGQRFGYRALVVCPGLALDWDGIEGLRTSLGQHGVTSNYSFQHTSYTWQQVQELRSGKALFTQPPMPIKCAGAPQKALYLSCDHWLRQRRLGDIQVDFCNAGGVLFGVADFVPPLMEYIRKYDAQLHFGETLVAVDGPGRTALLRYTDADGQSQTRERQFDFLHAVPPQVAPAFIRCSPLANADGWVDVDPHTLAHNRYAKVFSLGDVCSAPNAKTAAAVRKQAPVVAENLLRALAGEPANAHYDGYGACPLTVERGKVVLAEFGYGGALLPTFPLDPRVPRRLAWTLKTQVMPAVYFDLMLRGREWLAGPQARPGDAVPQP